MSVEILGVLIGSLCLVIAAIQLGYTIGKDINKQK